MSMLSFITEKEHQVVRDKMKSEFKKPEFGLTNKIVAPSLTKNYGIVGAAFDYLLRFHVEYHCKGTLRTSNWVANDGYNVIKRLKSRDTHFLSIIKEKLDQVAEGYKTFKINGHMTSKIFAESLFLAKLDYSARTNRVDESLLDESQDDINDLQRLYTSIPPNLFKAKFNAHTNPGFASAGIVNGADADLIIDGVLIEIKCVKELTLDRRYLNQLVGYYTLALLHNKLIPVKKRYKITHLGIYFARHAIMYKFAVEDLGTQRKFNAFAKWLKEYTDEYNQRMHINLMDLHFEDAVRKFKLAVEKKEAMLNAKNEN